MNRPTTNLLRSIFAAFACALGTHARLLQGLTTAAGLVCTVGCQSYAWSVAKWDYLRPTPYLGAKHRPRPSAWDPRDVTVTWLGQATVLINLQGTTILTDPVLTKRIAPPHWRTFILCPPERQPIWEPITRLKQAAGSRAGRIVCEEPGQVFVLPRKDSTP